LYCAGRIATEGIQVYYYMGVYNTEYDER
jgi:hypothetical protein